MQSLISLHKNHGDETAIVATTLGSKGEAITVVHLDQTADVVGEMLTARLKATTALYPFLVHGGFRGLLPTDQPETTSAEEAPTEAAGAEESFLEDPSESDADETDADVSIDATDGKQVIFAVFVGDDQQPAHVFLLTEGLTVDGETFGPLLVGLNDEELAKPSEALLAGLEAAIEWSDSEAFDGYLYLLVAGDESDYEGKLEPFNPDDTFHDATFTIGGEKYSVVSFDI